MLGGALDVRVCDWGDFAEGSVLCLWPPLSSPAAEAVSSRHPQDHQEICLERQNSSHDP